MVLIRGGLLQTLSLLLIVFAAAGACSPRLRRKYHELRQREEDLARAERREQVQGPPMEVDEEDIGERLIRAQPTHRNGLPPGAMQVQDIDPNLLAAQLASSADPANFNPTPYEMNSPEYNMAMIKLLLSLKDKGHPVREIETTQPLSEIYHELNQAKVSGAKDPLVCKTVPYNICYRMDERGNLHPIGDRRPVRILRVYKRK